MLLVFDQVSPGKYFSFPRKLVSEQVQILKTTRPVCPDFKRYLPSCYCELLLASHVQAPSLSGRCICSRLVGTAPQPECSQPHNRAFLTIFFHCANESWICSQRLDLLVYIIFIFEDPVCSNIQTIHSSQPAQHTLFASKQPLLCEL